MAMTNPGRQSARDRAAHRPDGDGYGGRLCDRLRRRRRGLIARRIREGERIVANARTGGLSRRGEAQRRLPVNRMRRHPPRLRFSQRTRGIRRSLRVGGSGLDWPDARATRSFRRQGQGEGARRALRRPLAPGGAHAVSLKEAKGLLRRSQRRGRDDQGDRRRGCGIRAVRRASDVEAAYRHSRQC
jgi:hypothetical protein